MIKRTLLSLGLLAMILAIGCSSEDRTTAGHHPHRIGPDNCYDYTLISGDYSGWNTPEPP